VLDLCRMIGAERADQLFESNVSLGRVDLERLLP